MDVIVRDLKHYSIIYKLPELEKAADEIIRLRDDNERLRDDNDRFRENELLLSKDGKTWRSAIDIIKEISTDLAAVTAERDRMREALKPFVNATVIDLTHNGENFIKAIVVSEEDIKNARAILEGATK